MFAVVLDCPDPMALAEFYQKMTGWDEITFYDDVYVYIGNGGRMQLGFQRVPDFRPPGWPDPQKRSHLDFKVEDMEAAAKKLVALGASIPEYQPGEDKWLVMADPVGNLFCVTAGF
jgi:hypothetical protein